MAEIKIYWNEEKKEIVYLNGGRRISFEDALKNAKTGKYSQVAEEWKGPIPCNIWKELQENKKTLIKLIKESEIF